MEDKRFKRQSRFVGGKMGEKIQVGLIGTGKHGSRYAGHLVHDVAQCLQLTAISRRSHLGEEQAAAWGAAYFADWRELVLSPRVEAVISAVTPNLNEEIGKLCVEAGKPLLLEKPLATDLEAGRRLVARFDGAGIPLTIAQTLRYNSVIKGLRDLLPAFGRLFSLFACQRLEPSTLPWLTQPEVAGGGVILHTAVHLFDALRHITGEEIARIRALSAKTFNPGVEDLMIAEIQLGSGALGIVDASKVSPARSGRYELVCEKGQLHGDQVHGILEKIEGATRTALPLQPPGPTLIPLLRDWHAFLCRRSDNPIPGREGLAALAVCHAARESVATGEWVEVARL